MGKSVVASADAIYFLLLFCFSNDRDGYSGMSLDVFYLVWLVCVI